MNAKPIKSSLKRIFFTPVDQQKFNQLRDRQYREIVRVDLVNIRQASAAAVRVGAGPSCP
ncbi:hypothetical protein [Arthrobacter glacialis]|uniref:Uncharacterized protein n=1 Tax=Arthrobacter glacialis TaxID=1664 RepID=A0A2S3ZTQ3_ARTGL|nr:hypothetical protein [Arthrobacter glacialis]POH57851.1 hypothetical protein CVS28_13870 [Arthrobacter glacialis]POH72651.1 hypothetical protein CVS27_14875 [Arthrobacter glacialis]